MCAKPQRKKPEDRRGAGLKAVWKFYDVLLMKKHEGKKKAGALSDSGLCF
jgi:hypothetical protein